MARQLKETLAFTKGIAARLFVGERIASSIHDRRTCSSISDTLDDRRITIGRMSKHLIIPAKGLRGELSKRALPGRTAIIAFIVRQTRALRARSMLLDTRRRTTDRSAETARHRRYTACASSGREFHRLFAEALAASRHQRALFRPSCGQNKSSPPFASLFPKVLGWTSSSSLDDRSERSSVEGGMSAATDRVESTCTPLCAIGC